MFWNQKRKTFKGGVAFWETWSKKTKYRNDSHNLETRTCHRQFQEFAVTNSILLIIIFCVEHNIPYFPLNSFQEIKYEKIYVLILDRTSLFNLLNENVMLVPVYGWQIDFTNLYPKTI